MISFENDYNCIAVPEILERLAKENLQPSTGYGLDPTTEQAKEKIRLACGCPDAGVYFTVGGTQTNQLVITALLQSYEGVVATTTGHVATHEAGAIEFNGHKILTLPEHDGRMDPAELRSLLTGFYADENFEHEVFPGMVYITFSTESGTLYSKAQLQELRAVCDEFHIPLYVDGARLGYGLMSSECDVTLPELAQLADVFYIGGTKVGAMFGEAIVFSRIPMPRHFMTIAKQNGALLAKGRILGLQFDTLFTDDLYFKISRHAIEMAELMLQIFEEKGIPVYRRTPTNQQFVLADSTMKKKLEGKVAYSFWETLDAEHTVIRFVTSWATREEDVLALRDLL